MRDLKDHHAPGDALANSITIVALSPDDNGLHHQYLLGIAGEGEGVLKGELNFQKGPRSEDGSDSGITEAAVMAVLLDRFRGHQQGPHQCRENAIVITKLEEALMWAQKRNSDRKKRGVLGTAKA